MTWREIRRRLQNVDDACLEQEAYFFQYSDDDSAGYFNPVSLTEVTGKMLNDPFLSVEQYCDEGDLIFV